MTRPRSDFSSTFAILACGHLYPKAESAPGARRPCHLHSLFQWFIKLSRDETPVGRGLAFAPGDIAPCATSTTCTHQRQLHLPIDLLASSFSLDFHLRAVLVGSPLFFVSSPSSPNPALVHRPPHPWHLVRDGLRVVAARSPLFLVASFTPLCHYTYSSTSLPTAPCS
jgi:hypothetical protein